MSDMCLLLFDSPPKPLSKYRPLSDMWGSMCAAIQCQGVNTDVPTQLGGDAKATVGHCGVGWPAH